MSPNLSRLSGGFGSITGATALTPPTPAPAFRYPAIRRRARSVSASTCAGLAAPSVRDQARQVRDFYPPAVDVHVAQLQPFLVAEAAPAQLPADGPWVLRGAV